MPDNIASILMSSVSPQGAAAPGQKTGGTVAGGQSAGGKAAGGLFGGDAGGSAFADLLGVGLKVAGAASGAGLFGGAMGTAADTDPSDNPLAEALAAALGGVVQPAQIQSAPAETPEDGANTPVEGAAAAKPGAKAVTSAQIVTAASEDETAGEQAAVGQAQTVKVASPAPAGITGASASVVPQPPEATKSVTASEPQAQAESETPRTAAAEDSHPAPAPLAAALEPHNERGAHDKPAGPVTASVESPGAPRPVETAKVAAPTPTPAPVAPPTEQVRAAVTEPVATAGLETAAVVPPAADKDVAPELGRPGPAKRAADPGGKVTQVKSKTAPGADAPLVQQSAGPQTHTKGAAAETVTETAVAGIDKPAADEPAAGKLDASADTSSALAAAAQQSASAPNPADTPKVNLHTVAHLAAQLVKGVDAKTTRFDVSLNPEGLGKVDVRIEIGARGDITAQMNFANADTAAQMQANSQDLQKALEQAGFDPSKTALSFSSGGAQQNPFQDAQNQQQQGAPSWMGRAFSNLADQADEPMSPASWTRQASGGVDVRI